MDFTLLAFKLHALEISDWTVVVAGISIVIGTLLVLIFVFDTFGKILSKTEAKKKKKNEAKLPDNMKPAPPSVMPKFEKIPAPVQNGVSEEVVAAISAAVYMMDGENATVTSITPAPLRKQNPITGRNPWAQAAVTDNTRPF